MKNIRLFILLAAALLICLPFAAYTQDKGVKATYYSKNVNPAAIEPPTTPWVPAAGIKPSTPLVLANNDDLWVGIKNVYDSNAVKYVQLYITANGELTYNSITAYKKPGVSTGFDCTLQESSVSDGVYKYIFRIEPQPDWEVIKFKNTSGGSITISYITGGSDCTFVPSLTTLGLGILILMLIAATYFVYRRRRTVTA